MNSRVWNFTISAHSWWHRYGQGMADAIKLVKWNWFVDGQIDNMIDEISGLVRVSCNKSVEACCLRKHVVVAAVIWLNDVQLCRAPICIYPERGKNSDYLIRLLLVHQQYTVSSQWQSTANRHIPSLPMLLYNITNSQLYKYNPSFLFLYTGQLLVHFVHCCTLPDCYQLHCMHCVCILNCIWNTGKINWSEFTRRSSQEGKTHPRLNISISLLLITQTVLFLLLHFKPTRIGWNELHQ